MKQKIPTGVSLLILVVIGLIVFNRGALLSIVRGDQVTGHASVKMIKEYEITRTETDLMENVVSRENILLFSERGVLRAFDLEGNALWSKEFNDNVILDHSRGITLVVEKQTGNTYLLNEQGEVVASNLARGAVVSVDLLENKTVLLFNKGNKRVQLLDNKLEQIADLEIPDGSIINADVSLEEQRIMVLVLKDNAGTLTSSFLVFSLQGEPLKNQALPDIAMNVFYQKNEYFVIYPWGIQMLDEKMNSLGKVELSKVNSAYRDGSSLYLTTGSSNPVSSKGELEITKFSLDSKRIEFHNKMKENYDNIDTNKGYVLMQQKNNVMLYSDDGALAYQETYQESVRKAMLPKKNIMILVYPDKITVNEVTY
ncbi:DUF5711 family protein [Guggenheimella bovis]